VPLVAAESVIHAWLAQEFAPTRVSTETPANLADVLPYIKVERFGGSDALLVLDAANIDVEVFAADRTAARSLAEEVRTSLRSNLPGQSVAGGFVADVATISAPTRAPYDNTAMRRFVASYRITIRSIP